jgi:hypothetical protein
VSACAKLAAFAAIASVFTGPSSLAAFEGRITATLQRSGESETLLYCVSSNRMRIERSETPQPYPQNIVNLASGDVTLVFPHNRSFVRINPATQNASVTPPGKPPMQSSPMDAAGQVPAQMPGLPSPPQKMAVPPSPGAAGLPGGIAAMSMTMHAPMMEKMELTSTGEKTNLFGLACVKYELKQRGEILEIWATDKLPAFQPYLANRQQRFGPRQLEDQWGDLLKAKKLFPVLAVLKFERPAAQPSAQPQTASLGRLLFEVKSITPEKITDESLFQPPPDYQEVQPFSF